VAYLDERDEQPETADGERQLLPAIVIFDPKLKKRLRFATMTEALAYRLAMRKRDKPDEKA
jgi:hypothetical protein